MSTPNDSRFDDNLRRQLDFQPAPIAGGWNRLRGKLPTPPKPGPRTGLRPFVAGLAVGLLFWGGHQLISFSDSLPASSAETPARVAATPPRYPAAQPAPAHITPTTKPVAPASSHAVASPALTRMTSSPAPASVHFRAAASATSPRPAAQSPAPSTTPPPPSAATPSDHLLLFSSTQHSPTTWHQGLSLDSAIHHALTTPGSDTGRTHRLRALIAQQAQVLAALQQRLDSVRQSLPEIPPALAADSAAPPTPSADQPTIQQPLFPAASPWSVVALLETTPSWSVMPTAGPGVDQERTQASLVQSVQLQRQLGDRWRFRAGAGQAMLSTQARYTSERIQHRTLSDSTLTTQVSLHQGTRVVRIINQGTGDTSYQYITTYDTVMTHRKVITHRSESIRDQRQQLLRPTYRFWTIPLSAQYVLISRNRWSLGVSLGSQLTLYRGGSRPVWTGEEYVLRHVDARQGPYRPVSLSLSGGLEAQYRLTPRLSALLAPTVRWWVLQPGKGGAASRTLLPAAQLGLSYGF